MTRWNATAHATLVLLSMGEASGYELKRRADSTLRFFFNAPAMSQVYTELDRLTAAGLVGDRLDVRAEAGERETRVFHITSAGTRRLEQWLADDPLPAMVFKSHLALRMMVGHLTDADRLREHLAVERGRIEGDLADLREVHDALDRDDPQYGWAWIVAEWGTQYYRDLLAQLDAMGDNIDALAASPRHGLPEPPVDALSRPPIDEGARR